ncbi:MAG: class F sortase [Nakamurella sp.]
MTPFPGAATSGPILPKSAPTTLTIPAIGVTDSPVLDMSLNADGSIEVPPLDDTKSSGWYNGSPTPGEIGPSVLLGHVDSAANGPSVFYKLGNLKPGDEIQVGRADGSVAVFKVDGVREYAKDNFPTQTIYGNLNHAGLRLITCGGTFNPTVGHYESNIIAFATLVSSR